MTIIANVEVWILVAIALAGVLLGAAFTIIATAVTKVKYRGNLVVVEGDRIERFAIPVQPTLPDRNNQMDGATAQERKRKADEPIMLPEGFWDDLDRRMAQRINYRLGEVAQLLGVSIHQVHLWISHGWLVPIVGNDRGNSITSQSVSDLLTQKKIYPPKEEGEEELGDDGTDREPAKLGTTPVTPSADTVKEQAAPSKANEYPFTSAEAYARVNAKKAPSSTPPVASSPATPPTQDVPPVAPVYEYHVDGKPEGHATLFDALVAMGVPIKAGTKVVWAKLSPILQKRITRSVKR